MGKIIIFTDLDGTLLDSATYSFEPALPALRLLGEMDIPVVITSSKTRNEIECYRRKLGNCHPFISENGGAIVIPVKYFKPQDFSRTVPVAREREFLVIRLGASYATLRRAIQDLRNQGFRITGFGDMSVDEVSELTKLPHNQAQLAKERAFDEPFIFDGNDAEIARLENAVLAMGLHLTRGRFFHLMGDSDKGKAVELLISLFREKYGEVASIALGDAPNDIPMLLRVDQPILVRKPDGSYDPNVDIPHLLKADGRGPEGWNNALLNLLKDPEYVQTDISASIQ